MKYALYITLLCAFGSIYAGECSKETKTNNRKCCHDTETGKYRKIRPSDKPIPMAPHDGHHPAFEKEHLQCNP